MILKKLLKEGNLEDTEEVNKIYKYGWHLESDLEDASEEDSVERQKEED